MRELMIVLVTAVAFGACGWAVRKVMGRAARASAASGLCIGVSDPILAERLAARVRRYSAAHPNVTVSFRCGTETELLRGLSQGKLDVILLPDRGPADAGSGVRQKRLLLRAVSAETNGSVWQRALWRASSQQRAVRGLLPYLRRSR